MKRKTKYLTGITTLIAICLIALFSLAGCSIEPSDSSLTQFIPGQELKEERFTEISYNQFVKQYAGTSYGYPIGFARDIAVAESAVAADGAAGTTIPTDFSQTNVQVAGVDEADIIKTDGKHIYTVSGNKLFIIDAYPGNTANILTEIELENRPQGLFIQDNTLVVFGEFRDLEYFQDLNIQPRQGMTYFDVYDITDRTNPTLEKEYKFEGNYFQSRMIEEHIYFTTRTGIFYRTEYPRPLIIEDDVLSEIAVKDIIHYPIPYQNPQFIHVHAISLETEEVSSKTLAVEGGQNLYMNEENMFITYTKFINEWQIQQNIILEEGGQYLTNADKEVIKKIENTDSDVLNAQEKQSKILGIIQTNINFLPSDEREQFYEDVEKLTKRELENYKYLDFTLIHKLEVDKGNIEVTANGEVPGTIVNQFSLDEYKNVLRIATTTQQRFSRFAEERTESQNHVFTLDRNLNLMDSIEGLAEGERIFSTRFIKDKLYMVTFRQVDPFFVIDLSNPSNIKELGELKIPGFSRYLQAYDEDTIIGIGRDATEQGRTQGLKISLFDVRDVTNPKEIAQFVADQQYSSSIAEYEHKAFLLSADKNLLVIPAFSPSYLRGEEQSYNGAMVFKIDKDEIELRGIIDHTQGQDQGYTPLVERSLYIEENLYTKSQGLLRINEIEDLSSVNEIRLETNEGPYQIF